MKKWSCFCRNLRHCNDFFQYDYGFSPLLDSFCTDSVIIGNTACAKTLPAYFCCLHRHKRINNELLQPARLCE